MIRLAAASCLSLFLIACSGADETTFDPTQSKYFGPADAIVDIDGQTIRYRESGSQSGQTVLMLHGFSDSLHTWDALSERLGDDLRILRPDLPGHGLSGAAPDGDYTNEALVDFVGAFLDATDTDEAIIVGNSLGGLAAWRYASVAPDRVSGLVLLAPGGVPHNGVGEEPLDVPMMLSFYLKNAPEAGVRTALDAMHVDTNRVSDGMVTQFADLMKMPGNGDAFVARAGSFTLPAPEADMAKVTVPTRILWGAQDVVLPTDHADVFVQNMPKAEVSILDQVGHMPQSEAADSVADAIRQVIAETRDGS